MKDIGGATRYTAAHLLSVCRSAPVLSVLSFQCLLSYLLHVLWSWSRIEKPVGKCKLSCFFLLLKLSYAFCQCIPVNWWPVRKAFKYFEKKLILLCAQTVTFNKMIFTSVYLQKN